MGDFYGTGIKIWSGFGPNGQLSCHHSFKTFLPRKPSHTLNEMTQFVTHFDVLKKYMVILKMCYSVNQIDGLQRSNKKYVVMDFPPFVASTNSLFQSEYFK